MTPDRVPSWRTVLAAEPVSDDRIALGVQLRVREGGGSAHWGPRRVQPATPRAVETGDGELRLAVRPLVPSAARDDWVQGEATWESLRRGAWRLDPARLRWFTTLYGIAHDVRVFGGYGDSDWLTLDGVDSVLLWPHLRAAAALGIPLVSTRADQQLSLADAATVEFRVDRAPRAHDAGVSAANERDGLMLTPVVRLGDEPPATRARPIGGVGVYTVERDGSALRVGLAPVGLGPATRAVLATGGPLHIPAADRDEFLRTAYPRLARETEVTAGRGVRLPPPERTVLVLTVDQQPRDLVDYAFAWHTPGSGRTALDGDTRPDDDERRTLRRSLAAAWEAASDLAFAPAGHLSGIDAAIFIAQTLPALEALDDLRIELSGIRRDYRELRGDPRIAVTTVESTDADWFELGVVVEVDGRSIPFRPLFTALAQRRKKILLSDGAYFSLSHPALDRLRDLIDESRDLVEWEAGPRISRYHVEFWEDFEDLADQAQPATSWRSAVAAFRDGRATDAEGPTAVPDGLTATLRPYQADGFRWLASLRGAGLGGILADDMGLGKTVQVLALLLHALDAGTDGPPALVVAPTSVVTAWRDEAARHAPGLRVHVVTGTGVRPDTIDADVVVTSYALLRLDAAAYAATTWSTVVFDEAQALKNPRTRVHRAALDLRATARFAVTGTPLENSIVDLWALLSLTSPGLFPSARRFRDEYVKPIEHGKVDENLEGGPARERRLARLRRRIRPFLLRRTKDLVAADLPPRQEQDVRVELTSGHRAVYERVLQRERRKVLGLLDDLDSHRFIVFRSLTLLRMLALAPALVDAGGPGLGSSKLDTLRERLGELAAEGHRALVFSQFTSYLDIVEADLTRHGIASVRLDGSTLRRDAVVDAFRGGDAPVFLISLKAGGVGLTLTEADYVFLLDPWWNPAAEQQAIDRAHRIGQTRPVTVYRLIAAGTIEEKVLELQQRKARLFDAVLDSDGAFSTALTADDIRGLLA
ncbi:DEAD/DEAH box helicase [Microbacterium telephonicum]|uniref:SNF2 family DNA or RNA helicase n=1 Tax=Microbacterium telephonicum TaxID=1714841 RepID=A0A498C8B6_9MICO|nr:DEAD/DEAH box helicase [Microbacterium telephonicum]RLK49190.1 SNF2 family DNA or RNA helicase [Microbacterium telephonicum]